MANERDEEDEDNEEEEEDEDAEEDEYLTKFINRTGPVSFTSSGLDLKQVMQLLSNFFNLLQVLKKVDQPQRPGSKRSYVEVEEDDDIDKDKEKKCEFDSSGSRNC